jgi:signal transduction histidine kinase
VTGRPRDLPTLTDLSAFRIIQEALTNTIRHAGPATAAVTVDYGEDVLSVEVTDTGRGIEGAAAEAAYAASVRGSGFPAGPLIAAARGPAGRPDGTVGHGLRGMRERATAAGGTLDIGPLPHGGFRVAARLPLGQARATAETTEATAPATASSSAPQEATR